MDLTSILGAVFRWAHVIAGFLWMGMGYYGAFVLAPSLAAMDGPTRGKVVTALLPRALYFFRWSSIFTWVTGILLLGLLFYHGGLVFENPDEGGWGIASIVSLVFVFGMYGVYMLLLKAGLGRNLPVFGVVAFVIIAAMVYFMHDVAGFSYRSYIIHMGAMFGTILLANGMRITPIQRRMITAIKEGRPPDQAQLEHTMMLSRHSAYISVPLLYTMIDMHTVVPGADSVGYFLGATLLGWLLVALIFARTEKVEPV